MKDGYGDAELVDPVAGFVLSQPLAQQQECAKDGPSSHLRWGQYLLAVPAESETSTVSV